MVFAQKYILGLISNKIKLKSKGQNVKSHLAPLYLVL